MKAMDLWLSLGPASADLLEMLADATDPNTDIVRKAIARWKSEKQRHPASKPETQDHAAKETARPRTLAARVLSMTDGELPPDIITREDFMETEEAQEAALLAQGEERKLLGRFRVRIDRGAQIEDCEYYFDARLGIVRHKLRKGPSREGSAPKQSKAVAA